MSKLPKFLNNASYDHAVGRMLRLLTNRVKDEMKTRLRGLNMNVNEFYVFMNLSERNGMSQTELSESMSMPAYGISRLIDSMIEKELVERRPNPLSRRSYCIFLTDNAKDRIPKIMGSLDDINDWILEPLDASERDAFVSALRKLV